MSNRSEKSKKRIKSLLILISLIMLMLIASTYAWFSTQKNVAINNLKGSVEVAEGLQISLDAKAWKQEIDLGVTNDENELIDPLKANWTEFDRGIGELSINGISYKTSNYRPIMNNTTGSLDETTGYMETVSSSGKLLSSSSKIIPFYSGRYIGSTLKKIKNITESAECGYYAFDIYLMNTSKFDVPNQLQLNFNSKVKEIIPDKENGLDFGLKNCVRVAFALYDNETASDASQAVVVSSTANSDIKQVAIWEPNFDQHSAYVMIQNDQLREIAENVAVNCAGLNTYAVKTGTESNSRISNAYDNGSEYLEEQKVNQTSGNLIAGMKLNEEDVEANATGVLNLKDIDGNDFKLVANSISKVRVYIWLEGQDPDCVNWASHSSGIDVTIGLCKDSEVGITTEPDED